MLHLLKMMLFTYGLGVLMLVGWRLQTENLKDSVGWIIYHAGYEENATNYSMFLDGTNPKQLIPPPSSYLYPLKVTPDGKWIFLSQNIPPDGKHFRVHPNGLGAVQLDFSPYYIEDFTKDSKWIIVRRFSNSNLEIFRITLDGSKVENLTQSSASDQNAKISPNQEWIVITVEENNDWNLYRMALDGSSLQQLTSSERSENNPKITLDGQWIFFVYSSHQISGLYRMRSDGSNLRQIFNGYVIDFELSPDNQYVIIESDSFQTHVHDLYYASFDGKHIKNLTQNPARDEDVLIDKNGRWIFFLTTRDGNFEIYRMRPDGSEIKNLTQSPYEDATIQITPDNKWIIFYSARTGGGEIYRMQTDGSDIQRLTYTNGQACCPSFIPLPPMPLHTKNLLALGLGMMTIGGVVQSRRPKIIAKRTHPH